MNHRTATFIAEASEGGKRKSGKRKSRVKLNGNIYCPELENMGRHIFDRNQYTGKHECRYCKKEDPAMAKPALQSV